MTIPSSDHPREFNNFQEATHAFPGFKIIQRTGADGQPLVHFDEKSYTEFSASKEHGLLWRIGQGILALFATISVVPYVLNPKKIQALWIEATTGIEQRIVWIVREAFGDITFPQESNRPQEKRARSASEDLPRSRNYPLPPRRYSEGGGLPSLPRPSHMSPTPSSSSTEESWPELDLDLSENHSFVDQLHNWTSGGEPALAEQREEAEKRILEALRTGGPILDLSSLNLSSLPLLNGLDHVKELRLYDNYFGNIDPNDQLPPNLQEAYERGQASYEKRRTLIDSALAETTASPALRMQIIRAFSLDQPLPYLNPKQRAQLSPATLRLLFEQEIRNSLKDASWHPGFIDMIIEPFSLNEKTPYLSPEQLEMFPEKVKRLLSDNMESE